MEEYKEKVSGNDKNHRLKGAVSSTLWLTIVLLYFLISFTTYAWSVTWLIFIIGAVLQNVISYFMGGYKSVRKLLNSTIWLVTLVLYFFISFTTGAWQWTWIMFLIAPLVTQIIKLLDIWREDA